MREHNVVFMQQLGNIAVGQLFCCYFTTEKCTLCALLSSLSGLTVANGDRPGNYSGPEKTLPLPQAKPSPSG